MKGKAEVARQGHIMCLASCQPGLGTLVIVAEKHIGTQYCRSMMLLHYHLVIIKSSIINNGIQRQKLFLFMVLVKLNS